jgi:hypothetical protein
MPEGYGQEVAISVSVKRCGIPWQRVPAKETMSYLRHGSVAPSCSQATQHPIEDERMTRRSGDSPDLVSTPIAPKTPRRG